MDLYKYSQRSGKKSLLNFFIAALVLVFSVIFIGSNLLAGGNPDNAEKYMKAIKLFEEYVQERMGFDRAVGFAVGFIKDDWVWTHGFGYADLENQTPLSAEGSFRMASITKTFTAIGILQLVEKGKIDLDAEVQTYVPYFPKKKWPVTVRLLLGHLGGISHYKDYEKEGHIKEHKNTREALVIFSDFDLVAEPGTRYNYSSYGFNLLGAVIEGASGQSYSNYIRENIFAPLGIKNSRLDDPLDLIPHRVKGYRIIDNQIKNSEFIDISSRFAGGGTRSTVVDMLTYARGIMDNKLLKEETTRGMFTSMVTRDGTLTGYGMGWSVSPWNGHFRVNHGGAQNETSTYILLLPHLKFAVATASNLEGFNPNPYIIRLTELILEADMDSRVYADNRETLAMLSACRQIFSYGVGYYDENNAPLTETENQLKEAFDFFSRWVDIDALQKNFQATQKKIDSGIHPSSKQAFTTIGSYMAGVLKTAYGEDALKKYQKEGFFAFFNDFINLSRKGSAQKKILAFPGKFTQFFSRWYRDWGRTYTDYTRDLVFTPQSDFKEVGNRLKKIFVKARIYPDFTGEMIEIGRGYLTRDEVDKAVEIFTVSHTLYPDSPLTLTHLAAASLWKGDIDTARNLFKKAFKINPGDRPDWLGWISYYLGEKKDSRALLGMATIAVELYPGNPEVHKTAGDIYLKEGKRKEAEAYYRKAICLGLDFAQVKEILEGLEKGAGSPTH